MTSIIFRVRWFTFDGGDHDVSGGGDDDDLRAQTD